MGLCTSIDDASSLYSNSQQSMNSTGSPPISRTCARLLRARTQHGPDASMWPTITFEVARVCAEMAMDDAAVLRILKTASLSNVHFNLNYLDVLLHTDLDDMVAMAWTYAPQSVRLQILNEFISNTAHYSTPVRDAWQACFNLLALNHATDHDAPSPPTPCNARRESLISQDSDTNELTIQRVLAITLVFICHVGRRKPSYQERLTAARETLNRVIGRRASVNSRQQDSPLWGMRAPP